MTGSQCSAPRRPRIDPFGILEDLERLSSTELGWLIRWRFAGSSLQDHYTRYLIGWVLTTREWVV